MVYQRTLSDPSELAQVVYPLRPGFCRLSVARSTSRFRSSSSRLAVSRLAVNFWRSCSARWRPTATVSRILSEAAKHPVRVALPGEWPGFSEAPECLQAAPVGVK